MATPGQFLVFVFPSVCLFLSILSPRLGPCIWTCPQVSSAPFLWVPTLPDTLLPQLSGVTAARIRQCLG